MGPAARAAVMSDVPRDRAEWSWLVASGYTLYKVCLPACCTGESWMTPGGDSTIYTNERAGRLCFITLETGQKIQWYNDNVIGGRSVSRSGKIFSVRDVGRFILISFRSVRLVQFTVQLGKTSVTVVRLPKFRFPPTPILQWFTAYTQKINILKVPSSFIFRVINPI